MTLKNTLLVTVVTMAMAACATTTATVTRELSARNADASSLRDVTVLGFTGDAGEEFANRLEAKLSSATLSTGERYFTVKERQSLNSRSGLTRGFRGTSAEVQAAVDYGQQNGVSGVYFGSIDADVDRSSYVANRQVCVEQGFPLCKKSETRQVRCTKLVASVNASPKLVNVDTSNTVYGRTISKSSEYSWCLNEQQQVSESALLSKAINDAVTEIRKDVAPWEAKVDVALKSDSSTLAEIDREAFVGAAKFAEAGRIDRACGIYASLEEANPENVELLYNLGVCRETEENFIEALSYYSRADSYLINPDKDINIALQRARALEQGLEFDGGTSNNPFETLMNDTTNQLRATFD
ncbi:MAG: hypothetical protein AAGI14_03805 [Pseudomonadota bacterium]